MTLERDFEKQLKFIDFEESRKIINDNREKMEEFLKNNIGRDNNEKK